MEDHETSSGPAAVRMLVFAPRWDSGSEQTFNKELNVLRFGLLADILISAAPSRTSNFTYTLQHDAPD
jgi:hypothetical protein